MVDFYTNKQYATIRIFFAGKKIHYLCLLVILKKEGVPNVSEDNGIDRNMERRKPPKTPCIAGGKTGGENLFDPGVWAHTFMRMWLTLTLKPIRN